jgi:hypothetical protein
MFTYLTEAAAAEHYADLRRQADFWRLAAAARAARPDRTSPLGRWLGRTGGRRAGQSRQWAANAASTTPIDALRAIPGYADAGSRPSSDRRRAA